MQELQDRIVGAKSVLVSPKEETLSALAAAVALAGALLASGRLAAVAWGGATGFREEWLLAALPPHARTGSENDFELTVDPAALGGMAGTLSFLWSGFAEPKELFSPAVATRAYYGLLMQTNRWRAADVTAEALSFGGAMLARGADREECDRMLYRKPDAATLAHWGHVLAGLAIDESGFAHSIVPQPARIEDEERLDAEEYERLEILVREFVANSVAAATGIPAKHAVIVWQSPAAGASTVLVWSRDAARLNEIAEELDLEKKQYLLFRSGLLPDERGVDAGHVVGYLKSLLTA